MKHKIQYAKTKKVFFKEQKSIFSQIYDRWQEFIKTSSNNPNQIYLGPKAYNDLMINVDPKFYPKEPNWDKGVFMGMKVNVSSHLMKNDIIILRTMK